MIRFNAGMIPMLSGPILENLIRQTNQGTEQENPAQANQQEKLPIPLFQQEQEPVNSQDALIAALTNQAQMQQLNQQPGQLVQPVQNGEMQPIEMAQQEPMDLQAILEMIASGSMTPQNPMVVQTNPFEQFRKSIVPTGFMQRFF